MSRNYAYVTLLSDNSYYRGVLILQESLRRVGCKYPLVCMVTEDVDKDVIDILEKAKVGIRLVDKIPLPEAVQEYNIQTGSVFGEIWKYTPTKFNAFSLTEFEKIVFLDADILVLKNLDHCFSFNSMSVATDGEYANLYPTRPHFNSGFMVIRPYEDEMEELCKFMETADLHSIVPGQPISDQDILNIYYKEAWEKMPACHLSKYYNVFPMHVPKALAGDVMSNAYFVHFTGTKPWHAKQVQEYIAVPNGETWVSVLVGESSTDFISLVFYEMAYAILELSNSNNNEPLAWPSLLTNGQFEYTISKVALDFFKDPDNAEYYVNKAIEKRNDYEPYRTLVAEINLQKRIRDSYLIIRDLLLHQFETNYFTNKNNLDYYFINQILSVWYSESAKYICTCVLNNLNLDISKFIDFGLK